MSGSFQIVPIGGGNYGGTTGLFVPTAWTQGVPGLGVTPELLQSQQLALQAGQVENLAVVSNLGGAEFAGLGNLFANWGNNLNSLGQAAASGFQTAVNNSAVACSGFFSCLFG